MKKRVIVYGDTPSDRQFALRAAERLMANPEKRDVVMVYGTTPETEVYAYRTKKGSVGAVAGKSPTTGISRD